jgi:hypothetical protein
MNVSRSLYPAYERPYSVEDSNAHFPHCSNEYSSISLDFKRVSFHLLLSPNLLHNLLTQLDLCPLFLVRQFVPMHRTREPALRSDVELLEGTERRCFPDARDDVFFLLQNARLGTDESESDDLISFG